MPIRTTLQRNRVQWILNALDHVKPNSLASRRLVSWIASHHENMGFSLPRGFTVEETPRKKGSGALSILAIDEAQEDGPTKQKRITRYTTIRETLQKHLNIAKASSKLIVSEVEKNLILLSERVNMSTEERDSLLFYIDLRSNKIDLALANIRDTFSGDDYFDKAAWFLATTPETLKARLAPKSVLRNFISYTPKNRNYGEKDIDFTADDAYEADRRFVTALSEPSATADSIISRLLGPTPTTELTMADFAYLGQDKLDYFVESLRGAVEGNGNKRKNYSLYGEPGVGKTEFTAVIANHLSVPLFSIGLSHLDNSDVLSDTAKEPSRQDRLLAWRRATFLVNAAHIKCLFLLDEADDILRDPNQDKSSNRASKGYLNWQLDNNNVPTIFVTNNIERFEESTVRRILPTLEITSAPREVQSRILLDYAKKYELGISAEQANILTREHAQLTSAVIETILYKTSRRADIKGNKDRQFAALQIGFEESSKALNHGSSPIPALKVGLEAFDTRLVASQLDIPALAADFKKAKSLKGLSLCLYGPQGAGKKTAMQYIAKQLDKETVFIDFNSLYGMEGFSVAALSNILKDAVNEDVVLVFNDAFKLLTPPEWQKLDSHPFFRAIAGHELPIGVTLHDSDLSEDMNKQQFWRLTGQFTYASSIGALNKDAQKLALQKIVGLAEKDADVVLAGIKDANVLMVGDFVRVANQMKFRPSIAENPAEILKALDYNAQQAGRSSFGAFDKI